MKYAIGFAVATALFGAFAWAQTPSNAPRFQIVAAAGPIVAGAPVHAAFRLNTYSGEVSFCYPSDVRTVSGPTVASVICQTTR